MSIHFKWRIIPQTTPAIIKTCPRCANTKFCCSERFRINSNKKLSDIWLIYKCSNCDYTWNMDIITRKNLDSCEKNLFIKLQENDPELAWLYAFDKDILNKNKVRYDQNVPVKIDGNINELFNSGLEQASIYFYCQYTLDLSIKKIIKNCLALSNAAIDHLYKRKSLLVENNCKLNTKINNGITITINLAALRELPSGYKNIIGGLP